MNDQRMREMWPQLTPSAQWALLKLGGLFLRKHSGVLEVHGYRGGCRLIRVPSQPTVEAEYRPGSEAP